MNIKSLLLTAIILMLFKLISAQSIGYKDMMNDPSFNFYTVCTAADTYFETHEKGKGSGFVNYLRWKAENESKYYPSGDRSKASLNFTSDQYQQFVSTIENSERALFPSGWNELGPFSANNITEGYNPGIGRVESFWVNPINDQQLFLGSRSGGFWKTNNGGVSWKNTTDLLVASGVNTIAVKPSNYDSVLINVRNGGNANTHGIYQSGDGGETWMVSNFNPANLGWGGLGNSDRIFVIKYHPTVANLVFIGTSKGFYRSEDNLQTWTQLLSSTDVTDIEFHPTNSNIMYLYDDYYNSSFSNKILISTDMGITFSSSSTISGNNNASGFISVTPTAPNNVYFASTNGVWKSIDQGQNFTLLSVPTESCRGFSVSDVDSNIMLYGYLNLRASYNGGSIFTNVTGWANTNPGTDYVHADLRTAESINGVFYVGTDGYLSKSSDNGTTWVRLNDGTAIREFYSTGVSQSNYDMYMAGSQDNGTSILNENGWIEWCGADGMEAIVHSLNPDWMMGSIQYGNRQVTKDGGATRQGSGNPESGSGNASWEAPLLQDHLKQSTIYHCAKKIYKSTDFGDTWFEFGNPGMGLVTTAAIANNNSEIMAAASSSTLRVTENSWATNRLASWDLPNAYITDVAFDPNRDSTMVVTFNTYTNDGKKVYLTTDLGVTWTNISFNLQDMPLRTVVIDHSDSSFIYVGAEIGIYVKSMMGNVWKLYNPNLPNVTVKDLEIQYGSNTLKAATWGRGLWEFHLEGKADYPAILHTQLTDTPTEVFPRAGYEQYVTSVISYNQNIKSAFVRWSNDSKELDHILNMSNVSDSTWKTENPIKNFGQGTDIYFRVYAVGQNNDTTETYRFQYEVRQGININSVKENVSKGKVNVYPNPSTGMFSVQLPSNLNHALIEIYDVSGKKVYSQNMVGNLLNVNIDLPKGSYAIRVVSKDLVSNQKLIIQ